MADASISASRAAALAGTLLALAISLPDRAASQAVTPPAAVDPAPAAPRTVIYNAALLGSVKLDKEHRRASFPASINQRTGVVEYAVVNATGKTHESVFRTQVEPQQVHLALLLLGFKPAYTNFFPEDLSVPPPGDLMDLQVAWQDRGREIRRPLEDFIITTNNGLALTRGPWVYNGSYFVEGKFLAQRDGSIVSIQIDPNALINNPRPGRWNDDLHYVNTAALPSDAVSLEISVGLASATALAVKPSTNRSSGESRTDPVPAPRKP